MTFVHPQLAEDFIQTLAPESVDLLAFDPPYCEASDEAYDKQWSTDEEYADWLASLIYKAVPLLKPTGSLVFFGAIGHHGHRPLTRVMDRLEQSESGLTFRDWITWKKRRAYGQPQKYLFCREEIVWYSRSSEPKEIHFNIPLTDELRGYAGFNAKYGAKSPYKRVSNVWDDIADFAEYENVIDVPELMRPERKHQKPILLMQRIVATHSNPGDKVVDLFSGWGTTGVAARSLRRDFEGCELNPANPTDHSDAIKANERVVNFAEHAEKAAKAAAAAKKIKK